MKHVEQELNGSSYSVVATGYPDVIHILVHKNDKINKMFRCQLYPQPGGVHPDTDLVAGVTPEALVGANNDDIAGQLYAEMIGSLILKQNNNEFRSLVLGLGDIGPRSNHDITKEHRQELLHVIKLVQQASVW